jgi:hypothetical protein
MRTLAIIAVLMIHGLTLSAQTLDPFYRYAISDTITDTESDTITLPALMLSPWSYNWTIQTTQLSGTQNVACVLQESASATGTDWIQIDSKTTTGSTDLDRMVGALIYGQRQRVILTGTGTQSTRYTIYFVAKK